MKLPVHKEKPEGLATKTDLAKEGLRPVGEPVAVWRWYKHRGRGSGWQHTPLYRRAEARPPTDEQLQAERDYRNALARERRTRKKQAQQAALEQWRTDYWHSINTFKRWATSPDFVVLDTETNGLRGQILEVAVVTLQGELLFESLVKNFEPLDPEAQKIHGITAELLAGAPSFVEIAPQLRAVLRGRTVLAFKVDFDYERLKYTRLSVGLEQGVLNRKSTACVMLEYAVLHGLYDAEEQDYRWASLDKACAEMGVSRQGVRHRAAGDALTTAALVQAVAAKDWPEQELRDVPFGIQAEYGL